MLRFYLIPILVLSGCRGGNDTSDAAGDPDADGAPDAADADADGAVDAIDPDADPDADPDDADAPDTDEDTADGCIVPDTTSDAEDPDVADVAGDTPEDAAPDLPADPPDDEAGDASTDGSLDASDAPDDSAADTATDADAPAFACGDPLADSRDGKSYATVLIGAQCWMAENLDFGVMIPGTASGTDNALVEKHCYLDDAANCDVCGGLYQWDELMAYSPSDAGNPSTTRGICPAGWHVPSDEEFKVLEIALGMTAADADLANTWRGAGIGTAMIAGGSSGYEAILCGRNAGGVFSLFGEYEYSYTSTESGTFAWRRCFSGTADTVGRWNTFPKTWSLSLRCVLD